MNLEKEIISYLRKYGNTREKDIVNYGIHKFNYSPKTMKKAVNRLSVKGKVHYIVHNNLEPPEVYISLKEPLPPKILRNLLEVKNSEATEDVRKILEEAAAVAKQKMKDIDS